ncbi:MAG: hypothetical protein AAF514_16335, partial [Verrucomicrobiota bacterium]
VAQDWVPGIHQHLLYEKGRTTAVLFWRYLAPLAAAFLLWIGIHLGIGAVEASPGFVPLKASSSPASFSWPGDEMKGPLVSDPELIRWLKCSGLPTDSLMVESCARIFPPEGKRQPAASASRNCLQCHRPKAI